MGIHLVHKGQAYIPLLSIFLWETKEEFSTMHGYDEDDFDSVWDSDTD